jgi:flagellar basal body-associated protein FliL
MADVINMLDGGTAAISNAPAKVAAFGHTLGIVMLVLFVVAILGLFVYFIWWWNSFKFTVAIRELMATDGHQKIVFDKAKRVMVAGSPFWRLRRRRTNISPPPSEAIHPDNRGFPFVECLHDEKSGLDDGYKWIIPGTFHSVQGEGISLKDAQKFSFSTEEKSLLADRIRRAEERKSRSLLDYIFSVVGMIFCVVIVFGIMIFYGEINKAQAETAKSISNMAVSLTDFQKLQIEFQRALNEEYMVITGKNISFNMAQNVPLVVES